MLEGPGQVPPVPVPPPVQTNVEPTFTQTLACGPGCWNGSVTIPPGHTEARGAVTLVASVGVVTVNREDVFEAIPAGCVPGDAEHAPRTNPSPAMRINRTARTSKASH
jgi:hypothetical protein